MPLKACKIEISERQHNILLHLIRRQKSSQSLVRRIAIILEAAKGLTNDQISKKLKTTPETVRRWLMSLSEKNFRSENIEALCWQGEGCEITRGIALAMVRMISGFST